MSIFKKIQVDSPISQIFQSPKQTYIALQVLKQSQDYEVLVYNQETLKLIYQLWEFFKSFQFISFDETEQYMLVYLLDYQVEQHPTIVIYGTSNFKIIKTIKFRTQLQAAYFQNQNYLILFNFHSKKVQQFDLETGNTFDILRYEDAAICPSIKQVCVVKDIRKFNADFIYKSMNLQKQLVVLQYQDKKQNKVLFYKLVKYDKGNHNQIIRTNRLFVLLQGDNYATLKICKNSQFKVLYLLFSTKLMYGNKGVRKFKHLSYLSYMPIEYLMNRAIIKHNQRIKLNN